MELEIVSEQSQPFPVLGKFSSVLPIRSDDALIGTVGEKSPSAKKAALRHPQSHRIFLDEEWQSGERGKGQTPPCTHPWAVVSVMGQHQSPSPQSLLSAPSLHRPSPQMPALA